MKENTRRMVLFAVIVATGSILIFVDIPLVYMLPLIMGVGFLLLVLLGSITVTDIKNAVSKLTLKNLRQQPFLKKLGSLKRSGKKTPAKDTVNKKADKNAPTKPTEKTTGIRYHLSLLASSITSFGKILTERKKTTKKTEEINKLLEHTITEKVSRGSALESATAVPAASGSNRGGAGGGLPAKNGDDADPFLSLSDEELGTSLLDGLDGLDEPAAEPQSTPAEAASGPSQSDLEMPPLPDEMAADAEAILNANADNGSTELDGLDGVGAIDETLGDLDNINLDDIDLGDDSGAQEPKPPASAPPADSPDQQSHDLIPATPITPVSGVEGSSFDADQSDMSSFAAGTATGSDEDMLSSLASDIKHVKKETDLSLLRELKDFKAPATEIEKDLMDMSAQLNAPGNSEKKKIPSKQGRK
jgi:hypothetical protein